MASVVVGPHGVLDTQITRLVDWGHLQGVLAPSENRLDMRVPRPAISTTSWERNRCGVAESRVESRPLR